MVDSAKDTQLQLDTLRAVVDGMAEGVWITSVDGTVLRHNDALQEMLFAGTELVGRKPIELVPNEALDQAVTRACKEAHPTWLEITIEGVRPRTLEVRVSALGPDLPGSAAVFHDVTERKWADKVVGLGVDGLICVNNRAGGHAGSLDPRALYDALKLSGISLARVQTDIGTQISLGTSN